MPAFLFNAPANGQQRVYLDESGTLGFGGEIFTMAMVLVRDLPKLEACTLRNRTTQSEVKASQMKTAKKLALARTLLEENEIDVYLAKLDPHAAMASERKLDKELLYDSMVAQALNFYLTRGDMARGLPYRISMDMRGGLRESYEDMVAESVGNVLMHRSDPLVTGLDVRFLDSKYSAGVQAADLFSNVYRTALAQPDSPCRSFLRKYQELGRVHAGFTFGLVELADQMAQIAADLRARVMLEGAVAVLDDGLSEAPVETAGEKIIDVVEEILELGEAAPTSTQTESHGVSRSARRRRSRATRRVHAAEELAAEQPPSKEAGQTPRDSAESLQVGDVAPSLPESTTAIVPVSDAVTAGSVETPTSAEGTSENGEEPKEAKKPEPLAKTGTKRGSRSKAKQAPKAEATSPEQSVSPAAMSEQRGEATDTPESAAPEHEQSKPDVRPGRASRSRQAAQATSRRQRTAKKAPTKQPATAASASPEAPAAASPEAKSAPTGTEPSAIVAMATSETTAPEPSAVPAPEVPAKKATTRRRRRTPAKQEVPGSGGTSGVDAKAVPPAEGATSSGPSGQEGSPAQAEV